METFDQPRELTASPHFRADRQVALSRLENARIDAPIRELIANLASISCCFTLQSCYGHFVHGEQPHPENDGVIDYGEALHIQQVRALFFEGLEQLIGDFL